jgi:hydroxyacylglutathione hydrolase
LNGVLLTHHHPDHSGGIATLLSYYPGILVYSSEMDKVPGVTHCVTEGEEILFSNLNTPISVLNIPGHTHGHIAFIYENALFCGDTLFSAGAGKIFEGTVLEMYNSLNKLKKLSKNMLVYCGHEYTLANIAFAQTVDPDNLVLKQRKKDVQDLRNQNLPSLPVPLGVELQTNPFLRCDMPNIIASVEKQVKKTLSNPVEVLLHLRKWKNSFT